MEFSQLYQFVGPPMTRGPPPLPLALIPRSSFLSMTSPIRAPPTSPFPPPLPLPPASRSKKYIQRLKPHHNLKPKYNGLPRHSKLTCAQPPLRAPSNIRTQLPPLLPETILTRTVPPETMLPIVRGGQDNADFDWSTDNYVAGVGTSARLSGEYDQEKLQYDEVANLKRPDARVKMSEIEYAYRASQSDPLSGTAADEDMYGEPPSIWATVLEICPHFFALDTGGNAVA